MKNIIWNLSKVICFAFVVAMLFASCNHDSKGNNLKNNENNGNPPTVKGEMEITALKIAGTNINPTILKDGKKVITTNVATPDLNITFKEKYEELKGEVKVKSTKQGDITFATASAKYTFGDLKKDEETEVEVIFYAKNKESISFKFKLVYKQLEPLALKNITVEGTNFVPPFETTLKNKTIEVKKNSAIIIVEAPDGTENLSGSANNTNLRRDPARQNIGSITLSNLNEGANSISLKVSAKDKAEVQYSFIINYTKLQTVGIAKITIDTQEFAKGSKLESLNGSEIELEKTGDIDIKVELEEDLEGKKVTLKNAGLGISSKNSDWTGKIATLKCKEEWKTVDIIIKAKDREDAKYTVKIERVKKDTIEVAQILLDEEKYGTFGKDLSLLLDSAIQTEKVNVKKDKVKVKVTLQGDEKVDLAQLKMQPSTEITLNFSGNIAEAELTLKEGENAWILHLEKTTKKNVKIEANYKFAFIYTKSQLAFNYIKLKMDSDDKNKEETELPYLLSAQNNHFTEETGIHVYKKENYSTWNTEATIISFTNKTDVATKYAVADAKVLPTTWTDYKKTFNVPLKSTPVYAYFKIEKDSETRTYLIEFMPKTDEKGIVEEKTDLLYLTENGNVLYADSPFAKRVKMTVKPQNPNIKGIVLKGTTDIPFTKIDNKKKKNWYFVEIPIKEPKTFTVNCEVTEHNDAKTPFTKEITIVPVIHEFALGYAEDMAEKVDATFENGKYTFAIEAGKVQGAIIYLRLKLHEYYVASCSDASIVFEGIEKEEIGGNTYKIKKVKIENFASPKNFTLTIKQDDDNGATDFPVEIKAN